MHEEERAVVQHALGRIFRIATRPAQEGDAEMYEKCRSVVLDLVPDPGSSYVPDWVCDRMKGAAGD